MHMRASNNNIYKYTSTNPNGGHVLASLEGLTLNPLPIGILDGIYETEEGESKFL